MRFDRVAVQAVLDGIARAGLDVAAVARAAGLPRTLPPRIDHDALEKVWREAIRRSCRPSLPLEVGTGIPENSFGLTGYLTISAATIGAALIVLQEALPLIVTGTQVEVDRRQDEVTLSVIHQPPFPGQTHVDLFTMGVLVQRLTQIPVRPLQPLRVELTVPTPPDPERWSQILGGSRLRFGAPVARLHLTRADCEVALRRSDPRLQTILRQQLALPEDHADGLLVALRALLRASLDDAPDRARVARTLGLSVRSLQRKLAASRTTFERELDRVRHDVADALLPQVQLSLGQIAARVGFAEQASFTRAFQRWTGVTPSQARRQS